MRKGNSEGIFRLLCGDNFIHLYTFTDKKTLEYYPVHSIDTRFLQAIALPYFTEILLAMSLPRNVDILWCFIYKASPQLPLY